MIQVDKILKNTLVKEIYFLNGKLTSNLSQN